MGKLGKIAGWGITALLSVEVAQNIGPFRAWQASQRDFLAGAEALRLQELESFKYAPAIDFLNDPTKREIHHTRAYLSAGNGLLRGLPQDVPEQCFSGSISVRLPEVAGEGGNTPVVVTCTRFNRPAVRTLETNQALGDMLAAYADDPSQPYPFSDMGDKPLTFSGDRRKEIDLRGCNALQPIQIVPRGKSDQVDISCKGR